MSGKRSHVTTAFATLVLVAALILPFAPAPVVAQDGANGSNSASSADEGFSEGFGTTDGDASSDAATGDGFGSDSSGDASGGFASFAPAGTGATTARTLTWAGRLRFDARALLDYDEPLGTAVASGADIQLELDYQGPDSEALVRLEFDEGLTGAGSASASASGSSATDNTAAPTSADEFLRTFVDEAYLRLYYDRFNVQAGYLKTVWGQGDQVHVVDFLNANDFTDFVNPDYIERRLAAGMVKVNVPWSTQAGQSGQIELTVLPSLRPDVLPQTGPWAPSQARILEDLLTGYAGALTATKVAPAGSEDSDIAQLWAAATAGGAVAVEDANDLSFTQFGARATASLGGVDLGAAWYWGFQKTPTPRIRLADPDSPTSVDTDGSVALEYDRLQGFGLEAATVLGPFNLRAEGAYYLTPDIAGDDPEVANNSIEYLAGFDVDLGVSSLNLNVQGTGTYILQSDYIHEAGAIANVTAAIAQNATVQSAITALGGSQLAILYFDPAARLNFQYDPDGIYTRHIVSAALTDRWANERIIPEVSIAVGIERLDWRLAPAVEFVLRDDVRLELSGAIFHGDSNGIFGQYDANDFAQIRFQYSF